MRRAPRAAAALAVVAALAVAATPPVGAAPRDSRADDAFVDPWWYEGMGLDEVHPRLTGEGVTIALLDDGLQRDAPALRGADIELMKSPCLGPDVGGDGGERARWQTGPRSEHGTIMASMIVGGGEGPGGPGTGIRGSAPDARLLFFDVDDERRQSDGLACSARLKAETYDAAVAAGADIISVSNGGPPDVVQRPLLEEFVARNEALVVASNNDTSPYARRASTSFILPAGIPGVLSVNALDDDLDPWRYSMTLVGSEGFGTEGWYAPAVSAMGVDLPVPGASAASGPDRVVSGTSPAAALAAGVMGLVKQRYPDATPNQLVQHAIHFTSRVRNPDPDLADMAWVRGSGYGLVAAPEMVDRDPTVWPDENPLLLQPAEVAEQYPTSLATDPPSPTGTPSNGSASPDPAADAEQEAAPATTSAADGGDGALPWVASGAAALLVAAVAAVVVRRRRSTPTPLSRSEHGGA